MSQEFNRACWYFSVAQSIPHTHLFSDQLHVPAAGLAKEAHFGPHEADVVLGLLWPSRVDLGVEEAVEAPAKGHGDEIWVAGVELQKEEDLTLKHTACKNSYTFSAVCTICSNSLHVSCLFLWQLVRIEAHENVFPRETSDPRESLLGHEGPSVAT